MLLPTYTIRQLLIGTVFAAFICAILGFAARGNVFAYGLGIAILGLVVPLAAYAFIYWTLWAVSKALPGTGLPIGPAHAVSAGPSAEFGLAKTKSEKQSDPGPGMSAARLDDSPPTKNMS